MKKSAFIMVLLVAFVGGFVKQVYSASGDGNASAVIVESGSIEEEVSMDFGVLVKPTQTGSQKISLSSSNLLNCPSGWTCTGSPTAGKFKIYGADGAKTVNYSNGTLSDGKGHTIVLFIQASNSITIRDGEASLSVGGELDVNESIPAGDYSTVNSGGVPYTVTIDF